MKFTLTLALAASLFLAGISAQVVAIPDSIDEGKTYEGVIHVPRGCDNSPTIRLEIDYDEELVKKNTTFTPQGISGWTVTLNRTNPNAPKDAVSGIVYSGYSLPNNLYGEFGLSFKVPNSKDLPSNRDGKLYFPVRQHCQNGESINWSKPGDKEFPAPEIKINGKSADSSGFINSVSMSLSIIGYLMTYYL